MPDMSHTDQPFEWPTLLLVVAGYGLWIGAMFGVAQISVWMATPLICLACVLMSSLQHEVIHGHPFRIQWLNEALVYPAFGLMIPYVRFRETHLAHLQDAKLTDPYDDPETNFLDPKIWAQLPHALRWLLAFNNTLAGRLLVGPAIAQFVFMKADLCAICRGDRGVLRGWLMHIPSVSMVLYLIWLSPIGVGTYLIAIYAALSVLKIRTFLEHRAHDMCRARTVVIEDRGLLALLFLNNNFHIVHHLHPDVAWYKLPGLYWANRQRYLAMNDSYLYGSYKEIFRAYFWRRKDPVEHPLWPKP
jgi:fatty acid desaturase